MEKKRSELIKILHDCSTYIVEKKRHINALTITVKSLNSLVTTLDIASENYLTDKLSKLYPEATFLTEENTVIAEKSNLYWIIDPIDGTTNFIHGVPFWGISVALCMEGRIVLSAIADVPHHDIYSAVIDSGAYKNNKCIHVSTTNKLKDALIATGFPYYDFSKNDAYMVVLRYLMENSRGIRRCGAASLDLCYTASGTFDGFFEYGLSPWDVAAGALIVQEAGGMVFDFSSDDNWLFGKEIIACNKYIAEEFATMISKVFR